MTDITARSVTGQNNELEAIGVAGREHLTKRIWLQIANRIWDLAEKTGEMDTKPFKGVL